MPWRDISECCFFFFFFDNSCYQNQISKKKKIVSGLPAYFILSSRFLRSHFLPLDSKAHFSPLPRVVKNKHQMSTALGLAAYQSLICSLSQAMLGTARDLVAEAHPMGQAISPKATWQCCWHKWLQGSGLTEHIDPVTREESLFICSLAEFTGLTCPFYLMAPLLTEERI